MQYELDKVYLPSYLIGNNYDYTYTSSENRLEVRTKNNCASSQCDCYSVYFNLGYVISPVYQCSAPTTSAKTKLIAPARFTDDIFYRHDFTDILITFSILFIFVIYFPIKIFSRLFGRWLKL